MTPRESSLLTIIFSVIIAGFIVYRMSKDSDDPSPYWMFVFLPITVLIAFIPTIIIGFSSQNMCKQAIVTSVGGCDRYGDCSFMTDIGIKGFKVMPVTGEKTFVDCNLEW